LLLKITFVDIGIPDGALKVIALKEILAFDFFFQNNQKYTKYQKLHFESMKVNTKNLYLDRARQAAQCK
jgi:hypothetical protein